MGVGRAVGGSEAAWRPVHIDNPAELATLTADDAVQVIDTIGQQRRDLAQMLPEARRRHADEPSRWYYYSWRRTLVHLLGPHGFRTLRSDRNRNKITVDEQQRLRSLVVGVVGLSVGHSIAHTLVLEGLCGEIRLADFDEIELSNLNRIPATVFDLHLNKAVVLARRIAELDPYVEVRIEPAGLNAETAEKFVDGLDLVIEECDSFDVKLAVREAARQRRIPFVSEASDRGLLDVERYDLDPERPLFHGLLGDAEPADLTGLSTHDKVPYVLRTVEPDELSPRMAASMAEVDETLSTWPQLGGEVTLGAALVAAAVRALGLGRPLPSGRIRFDIDAALGDIADPPPAAEADFGLGLFVDPEPAPHEAAAAIVHAARLAPSGGNTQPWRFVVDDGVVQIELDPTRTSTLDVAFRGSYVAIGAALFNARVAAARHGVLGDVQVFPRGRERPPAAALRFGNESDPALAALYEFTLRRASNRHVNEPRDVPDGVLAGLQKAARNEGAEAHIVSERLRLDQLGELLGEADRVRFLTEHLHREMMRELRWPGTDDLEWGIDVRTLELDDSDLAKLKVARRADVMAVLAEQDLGRALGESTRVRLQAAPAVVVVTVDGAEPGDFVRGGQAVERVWIEAERQGLAVHPMSPVFMSAVDPEDYEVLSPRYAEHLRRLRHEFDDLTGVDGDNVALVMRIGYAPKISVRSRRLPAHRTVRTARGPRSTT